MGHELAGLRGTSEPTLKDITTFRNLVQKRLNRIEETIQYQNYCGSPQVNGNVEVAMPTNLGMSHKKGVKSASAIETRLDHLEALVDHLLDGQSELKASLKEFMMPEQPA